MNLLESNKFKMNRNDCNGIHWILMESETNHWNQYDLNGIRKMYMKYVSFFN